MSGIALVSDQGVRLNATAADRNTPLTIRGLTVSYGQVPAVYSIDFTVPTGSLMGIVGPNGAGKSTLVGLILDQIPYFQGSILRSGLKSGLKGIVKVSFEVQQKIIAHEARKERYEAFSGIEEQLLTVSDLLKAESAFKEETDFKQKAQNLIQESGLETLLNRSAQKLSNGEMRKTLLVQALLQNP